MRVLTKAQAIKDELKRRRSLNSKSQVREDALVLRSLTETELAEVAKKSPSQKLRRIAALWLKARLAHMAGDYYSAAQFIVQMKQGVGT